jgi:hypothetical protein
MEYQVRYIDKIYDLHERQKNVPYRGNDSLRRRKKRTLNRWMKKRYETEWVRVEDDYII